MFEAQLLIAKDSNSSVYSPWFAKGGDNAIFTLEIVEIESTDLTTITVEVFTKTTEEVTNGAITA